MLFFRIIISYTWKIWNLKFLEMWLLGTKPEFTDLYWTFLGIKSSHSARESVGKGTVKGISLTASVFQPLRASVNLRQTMSNKLLSLTRRLLRDTDDLWHGELQDRVALGSSAPLQLPVVFSGCGNGPAGSLSLSISYSRFLYADLVICKYNLMVSPPGNSSMCCWQDISVICTFYSCFFLLPLQSPFFCKGFG